MFLWECISFGCLLFLFFFFFLSDVYTEVLPAAKGKFACKRRVTANVGVGLVSDVMQRLKEGAYSSYSYYLRNNTGTTDSATTTSKTTTTEAKAKDREEDADKDNHDKGDEGYSGKISAWASKYTPTALSQSMPALLSSIRPYFTLNPGMNISFVLEGIMSQQHGLRPFDTESFRRNNKKQPLYFVSSTVRNGTMETVAFSEAEGDFFDLEIKDDESRNATTDVLILPQAGRLRRMYRAVKMVIFTIVKAPALVLYQTCKALVRLRFKKGEENNKVVPSLAAETEKKEKKQTPWKKITAAKSPLFRRLQKKAIIPIIEAVATTSPTNGTQQRIIPASACPEESGKGGFFACLESSMLVPGAAGKPVKLLRSKHRSEALQAGIDRVVNVCFDAFCCKCDCTFYLLPFFFLVNLNAGTHFSTRPGFYLKLFLSILSLFGLAIFFQMNQFRIVLPCRMGQPMSLRFDRGPTGALWKRFRVSMKI